MNCQSSMSKGVGAESAQGLKMTGKLVWSASRMPEREAPQGRCGGAPPDLAALLRGLWFIWYPVNRYQRLY